jgi:chromodomain-helicase-DNA-binding protein 1
MDAALQMFADSISRDYLAETWWPQAKNVDKRTSGQKLRALYEKIAAAAKTT